MGFSWNGGTPSHHPFYQDFFPYQPTNVGVTHLWKTPYMSQIPIGFPCRKSHGNSISSPGAPSGVSPSQPWNDFLSDLQPPEHPQERVPSNLKRFAGGGGMMGREGWTILKYLKVEVLGCFGMVLGCSKLVFSSMSVKIMQKGAHSIEKPALLKNLPGWWF